MSKTVEELAKEYVIEKYFKYVKRQEDDNYELLIEDFIAGYQAAAPQWISVKDRLPLDAAYVLVNLGHCIEVLWYGNERFAYDDGHELPVESCASWMPLPKPPEDK
jgi:hypothetical protein